jgi:hypothetical protein
MVSHMAITLYGFSVHACRLHAGFVRIGSPNRASGLNLVTPAIVLWNTVYLERATQALREAGKLPDDGMLRYLSPLGWEHINLTGDYVWRQNQKIDKGQFRPLRDTKNL